MRYGVYARKIYLCGRISSSIEMIEFRDVTFIYDGKPLIEHFTETIETGEKVVLYGSSGTGKSTLLGAIAGFVRPDNGEIAIDGKIMNGESIQLFRQQIAWVPQEFTLPYNTVREMIDAPFLFRINRQKRPSRHKILKEFEKLGLEEILYEKKASEVSGGQRQRIMIVIARLLGKEYTLVDEPTSALDENSIGSLINYIQNFGSSETVVMVSHDNRFISAFDRKIQIGV